MGTLPARPPPLDTGRILHGFTTRELYEGLVQAFGRRGAEIRMPGVRYHMQNCPQAEDILRWCQCSDLEAP